MAKNFGARKNNKYKVVSTSPSVNKTPRGPSIPPIPYDVQQDLSSAEGVSDNVNFNGDPVYLKTSHSSKVTGDAQGSAGGVKSGTVGAQSDPIEASPSVFVNGKAVVRVGDTQYMQNKNTVGKVVSSESGSAAHITDEGKIEGLTEPDPIAMPYSKNKPTNNPNTSGSLGSFTGSPVLLGSGKLFFRSDDVRLKAPIALELRRDYIGDDRIGIFGRGWQSIYESRLLDLYDEPSTLVLTLTDNRTFRFYDNGETFIDKDDLGARLTRINPHTFVLEYFNDLHTERYENGYLREIKDRNGNILTILRNSGGKPVKISSSETSLSFEYNHDGLVSSIFDHTERTWRYAYTTKDPFDPLRDNPLNLTHVTDPMEGVQHYIYQENAPYLLEKIIDPSGTSTLEISYDLSGRVESYRESGETYRYRYETNRVTKTDSAGDRTFYGIDTFGAICAITYPDGSTTREIYENNTSTVIDAGGNTFISEFDERGRLIREQRMDPTLLNPQTLYTYEGENPFITSMTREGKTTLFTYDNRCNLLGVTYSDGTTENYTYDDRGNRISYTDTEGVSTEYAYNALGLQIRVSDALGGITQYVYDELGNTTALIDPEERITRFEYDKLSRRIAITANDRQTVRFYYDNAGRIGAIRDPQGNMTRYAYDGEGFLSRMINSADKLRTFTREGGKLTAITREDGQTYRFGYDKRGRKISQSIGDKSTLYTYDSLGNLLSVKDASGSSEAIEYVYDSRADIVLERQGSKSIAFAYNLEGQKRFIGYEGMHFNLMRNEQGVLESIVQGGSFSYRLAFDARGLQTALSYPNRIQMKSVFDPLGRLTERSLGDTALMRYAYDKSSRIIAKNAIPITYDTGCRVVTAGEEKYTYDTGGNLLKENSVIDPVSGALLQQGDTRLSYDMMGRLIEKHSSSEQTTYEYDIEGYLIRYVKKCLGADSIERVSELRFTYDPLGRRRTKHYRSFVPNRVQDETTEEYHHRYLYDGPNIVAIYDTESDELLATLLHEPESVDSPLSIHVHPREALTQEEQTLYDTLDESGQFLYNQSRIRRYYYHRDHQNSIIALSDENAVIVEYYEYDVYGNITKAELANDTEGNPVHTLNPYKYTGREYDTDDLYYYRARYYDPTIGRFITPDPIGFLAGDTNFYRYVGNDPVNHIDPTGLSKCNTQEEKHKKASEKLKDKKSFKWKKALKSGAKKAGGGILFFVDGPLPIGDIFGAALLASDVADGIQTAQEITEAMSDLESAASELDKCHKEEQKAAQTKKDDGVKVKGEEPPKKPIAQVEKNKQKGDKFANEKTEEFRKEATVEKEITIKVADGTKTRIDATGIDNKTSNIRLQEYKSSETAPLTINQKNAFPQLAESGGVVVGKGKGAFTGGTIIPPTKVEIIRPK